MENRKFEKLDVEASLLGFGCMRFPLDQDGHIEEIEAEKMIDLAIESGVTYIDTAYPYHDGDSEPFVGRVLKKYPRESFKLATKLPIWNINSQQEAMEMFDSQLKRLDVEYVDFYLLHALDADKWKKVKEYHIIEMCEELRKQGKIKYLGFSFHDEFNVFEEIIKYHSWDFCQLQLNYMDMEIQAGEKGVNLANELGIPLVVMEPIKGGSLAKLPEDVTKMFKDYNAEATLASWALRYVGTLPGVKVILSGMSTLAQVEDTLHSRTKMVVQGVNIACLVHLVSIFQQISNIGTMLLSMMIKMALRRNMQRCLMMQKQAIVKNVVLVKRCAHNNYQLEKI